jgi:hypothetical protein
MPVYTPPALDAVDFALTEQPAQNITPEYNVLSAYSVPSLSSVDFALVAYTPPTYNTIDFNLLRLVLVIQNATHAQAADNISLTQHHVLVVQSALHAHAADNVALTQHHVLAIQNSSHAQTADNVTLTAYSLYVTLTIQNATHVHSADNIELRFPDPYRVNMKKVRSMILNESNRQKVVGRSSRKL